MFVCGCWFFGVSMMTLMIVSVVHKYIKLIIWQMHESLIGINEKLWYEKKKKKKKALDYMVLAKRMWWD